MREQSEMPTQPPIDGLPLWAQLVISFIVGLATLAVAIKGYLIKEKPSVTAADPSTAAIMAAQIADMGAIRHLSDVCIELSGRVRNLTDALEESTHHHRVEIELDREICARLRELREAIERMPRT